MINHGLGVSLRRIEPADRDQLFRWRNDERVFRWCRQNEPIHWANHAQWMESQSKDASISMFAVVSKDGETLLGVCGLTSIDPVNRRAEFSLYIDPERGRKGLGFMALKTLLFHAFDVLGLNVVWGETFEDNPAQRMFSKVGMKLTGIRPEFYYRKGRFIDAKLFSITRAQWQLGLSSSV